MTGERETLSGDSHADLLALLDRIDRENPTVAASALDREVQDLLGRTRTPSKPATVLSGRGGARNDPVPSSSQPPAFGWYQQLTRQIPPVLSNERQVEAAIAIEAGLLAQERLDEPDRELSRRDRHDLQRLVQHGQFEYELLIISNLRLVFH